MKRTDLSEDGAFFLYLATPIIAIGYGAYEWYVLGKGSSAMPQLAYFIVTKSQYLFLLSIVLVCAAIVIEVQGSNYSERERIIYSNSTRLQYLAIAVLIISFLGALSVVHYSDLGQAFANFLNGRYPLIFGLLLLGTSILLAPSRLVGRSNIASLYEVVGLLLMAVSPAVLYGIQRIHFSFPVAFAGSILSFAVGLFLLLYGTRRLQRPRIARVIPGSAPRTV